MAYGIKIWTANGYVAFDSENMNSYVKVISSGTVLIGAGRSETIAVGTKFSYYYVKGPTVNWDRSFNSYKGDGTGSEYSTIATSFTIENLTNESVTFGYIVLSI